MTVYVPHIEFEHGAVKWNIASMEAEECRRLADNIIKYRGTDYSDNFYTTEEAARAYIRKEYYKAEQFRYRDFIDNRREIKK